MRKDIFMGRVPSMEDWYAESLDFSSGGVPARQVVKDLAYPSMVRSIYEHHFAGLTDQSSMGEYLAAGAAIYRDNDALNRKLGIRCGGAVDDSMAYQIAGQILHVFDQSPVLEYRSAGHLAEKILEFLGLTGHGPMIQEGEKAPHERLNDELERRKFTHLQISEAFGYSLEETALLRGGRIPLTKELLYHIGLSLRMSKHAFLIFVCPMEVPGLSGSWDHTDRDEQILSYMDNIRLIESIQPEGVNRTPTELVNRLLEKEGMAPINYRLPDPTPDTKKETILITGGRGFIGRHCVSCFREQYQVCILSSGKGPVEDIPDGVRFYYGSLLDPLVYERILAENHVDYVLHLAAIPIPKEAAGNMGDAFSLNAQGVNVLCNTITANRFPVKGLIFPSTENIYRGTNGVYQEDAEIHEQKLDPYAWSKFVAETAIRKYTTQKGLRAYIVRLSNIYGPGDSHTDNRLIPRTISLLAKDQSPENMLDSKGMPGKIDLLYVEDLVSLFGRMLLTLGDMANDIYDPSDITFNAGSGVLTDIGTIQETIQGIMGKEEIPIREIRTKTPCIERKPMEMGKTEWLFGPVARTSLEDGIRRTVEEYGKE